MKPICYYLASVSILCLLGGCSATVGDDLGMPPEPDAPDGEEADPVIEANVSATFPGASGACEPLGFPVTAFLSNAFGQNDLVEETATPSSGGDCLREQVLAAPADAWAKLAYIVICRGGDDARRCGATATRQCSVDLLTEWAEARSEQVSTREPIFGFVFDVPPQDEAARAALSRRAQQELRTLLDETAVVIDGHASGTRACPDEEEAP